MHLTIEFVIHLRMPNAKIVPNRQRPTRAVRNSKGTSRTKQASVRWKLLRVPITVEIERQLKELIAKFGEKKVNEALDPLLAKCKWNYWQSVANAISRIARQKSAAVTWPICLNGLQEAVDPCEYFRGIDTEGVSHACTIDVRDVRVDTQQDICIAK